MLKCCKNWLNPCGGALDAATFAVYAAVYLIVAPLIPQLVNALWVALQFFGMDFLSEAFGGLLMYYTMIGLAAAMPLLLTPVVIRRLRTMDKSALWSLLWLQSCILTPTFVSIMEEKLGLYESSYDEGIGGAFFFLTTMGSQLVAGIFLLTLICGCCAKKECAND
ncbi:MAG: hypothetical protein GC134_00960 [Proteobacteria bacterium]|nr:hypothetical protein [Pseudomonadota bacterium]